jgi:hypothetical protein
MFTWRPSHRTLVIVDIDRGGAVPAPLPSPHV